MTGVARGGTKVFVMAAVSTGCAALTGRIGLPLVHVDATTDVAASLARLNAARHGSGVRIPKMFQPVVAEDHWDDWDLFPIPKCRTAERTGGVRTTAGTIMVDLPSGTTLEDFRAQLHAALAHLRLQDVAIRTEYMDERSDALVDYVVEPRYTLLSQRPVVYRGAVICRDIYVLDPAELHWRLLWLVVAARLAAVDGRTPTW